MERNGSRRRFAGRAARFRYRRPGRRASVRVVVLDNDSDDGSIAAIRAAHPEVEVIAQDVRRGFGANQNAIIQATGSRYVLALNNDTLVSRGALDTLVRYLDEHPGVGAAGPRVIGPGGEPRRRMHKMLHHMQHHRLIRLFRKLHNPL